MDNYQSAQITNSKQYKEIIITDKHGNKKKKIINIISKGDVANIKNMKFPAKSNRSNYLNDNGVRSGSPGNRQNANMD
jgi:hypothetical protein